MPKTETKTLTDAGIKNLTKPGHYTVGGDAPGLLFQVTPSGAKSFVVRLTLGKRPATSRSARPGQMVQRRIDFGLGAYPQTGLKEARTKAREYRMKLLMGVDPRAERIEARSKAIAARESNMTFRKASAELIESMRPGWKSAKHAEQWTNTLETYAGPIIGDMLAGEVQLRHVIAVLKQPSDPKTPDSPQLWHAKTETASRVRSRIEAVLSWAQVHGHRHGDNPARWKNNLDKVFPAPKTVSPVEHHPALPVESIPAFMRDLRARDGVRARALEFTILTALRVGRVVQARWCEIDIDAGVWTIPADLMKGRKGKGREHRVPLCEQAISILKEQAGQHGEWVFPGMKENKPVTDAALSGLLVDMNAKDKKGEIVTTHGFRSTFRDWAAEFTDHPPQVAEMALAHAIGDQVEAAYRRGDLFEKRRALMCDWSAYCTP